MPAHDRFDDEPFDDVPLPPSKTRLKQEMHELQALALALLDVPERLLNTIDVDRRLIDALNALRTMKTFSAQRRQQQYIGKLIRNEDAEPIRRALDLHRQQLQLGVQRQKLAESWRDRLLGDPAALTQWVAAYPQTQIQPLRQLLRKCAADVPLDALNPAQRGARRELFRRLREQLDAELDSGVPLPSSGEEGDEAEPERQP